MDRHGSTDGGEDRLAPVIPLFGTGAHTDEPAQTVSESPPAQRNRREMAERPVVQEDDSDRDADKKDETDQIRELGEASLVRKLRARSLSISEARQVLRGHSLEASQIDDVIDAFCGRGYLDDLALAEQLVLSGVERKGQGRVALSRALAQRGIPRDVIDRAMGDLPDDDAERALDFARTKARSLSRLDFDTALRRLVGQLARRGYGGSIAMTAAKTALNEAAPGQPSTGVRFVDSE